MQVATKEALEGVQDMHRGLHLAMEELIRNKDYDRAEQILRQLDQVMSRWLNDTKISS